jgi:RNA polymerase sigma-70 factor, ECF subfamily
MPQAAADRMPQEPRAVPLEVWEGPGSEEERLAALQAGRPGSFEDLVRRETGPMLAVARRILHSEADARDAVQDAFRSAFEGIARFEQRAKISTWLHRIVLNAALMRLRSGRRRPERPIEDLLPAFDETGAWSSSPSWHSSAIETELDAQRTRALVRACIRRLPETSRTVLLLRDIEDLDTDETAAMLGVSPNAVKVRLHRARQALRTLIERAASPPAAFGSGTPSSPRADQPGGAKPAARRRSSVSRKRPA